MLQAHPAARGGSIYRGSQGHISPSHDARECVFPSKVTMTLTGLVAWKYNAKVERIGFSSPFDIY
jgi:hypothetical protein